MLALALQTLKLTQHVSLCLGQGTGGLQLLLRQSPVLLLNMQAQPVPDQQAGAGACTCASPKGCIQPPPALHSPITQQPWHVKAVNKNVKATEQSTTCLGGRCTTLVPNLGPVPEE